MNVGQVLEAHSVGARWDGLTHPARPLAMRPCVVSSGRLVRAPIIGLRVDPVFDGANWDEVEKAGKHPTIQQVLGNLTPESIDGDRLITNDEATPNGRTGEAYDNPVTVGYMYI